FFQAEDGIRDDLVTGVQTCALPIYISDHLPRGAVPAANILEQLPAHAAKAGWNRAGESLCAFRRKFHAQCRASAALLTSLPHQLHCRRAPKRLRHSRLRKKNGGKRLSPARRSLCWNCKEHAR